LIFTRREVAYPLVLVWAFAGIYVKQAATPVVAMIAALLALVLLVLLGVSLLRSRRISTQVAAV
jgi:hypothetical protein